MQIIWGLCLAQELTCAGSDPLAHSKHCLALVLLDTEGIEMDREGKRDSNAALFFRAIEPDNHMDIKSHGHRFMRFFEVVQDSFRVLKKASREHDIGRYV